MLFYVFYWPTTNILQYVKIIYTLQTNYIKNSLHLVLPNFINKNKNGFDYISFIKYGWAGCLIKQGCSFYVTFYGFIIFFVLLGAIFSCIKNNPFEYSLKNNQGEKKNLNQSSFNTISCHLSKSIVHDPVFPYKLNNQYNLTICSFKFLKAMG